MKNDRQSIILEIIEKDEIETQFQLLEALRIRGIQTTQATLSRDIKDMHLVKEADHNGNYRYVAARKTISDHDQRLRNIFKECVVSYDVAQNLFILRTLPGLASAACSAIDGMEVDGLVGTLAGDDTAFLAMRDNDAAQALFQEIRMLL